MLEKRRVGAQGGSFSTSDGTSQGNVSGSKSFSNQMGLTFVPLSIRKESSAAQIKSERKKSLKQIVRETGYKVKPLNTPGAGERSIMKKSSETEGPRNTKAMRRLAGPAGLILLGILIWTVCGCVASGIANEARGSRGRGDWYRQCRVEVRQLISIVEYVLTPEDDIGDIAALVVTRQPILPALDGPTPDLAPGTGHVGTVPSNVDRH